MVDTNDDTKVVRHVEVTRVVRRRRWSHEEKGRVVAEAVAPGAVIADVARRHDLAPQHLSNWIRAAKDGRFALPADAFVPVIAGARSPKDKETPERPATPVRDGVIEIAIGDAVVRVPPSCDPNLLASVLGAIRHWR